MNRFSRVIPFSAILGPLLAGLPAIGGEPLKIVSKVATGSYFVGEGIEVRVEAQGIKESAAYESPKSSAFDSWPLPIDQNSPSVGRFLVVPKRAGLLEIPPFRAKIGDRTGSSRTIRLTIGNIPADGRGVSFLGGVGTFELKGEAEPTTLRQGQSLEYRLKLTGPAAWGSDRVPDLSGWGSLAGGFRVEALPEILEGVDPPVRTFRYRLRPKGSGRVVLPPVAVSAFDPKVARFTTRTTSSVPIVIEKPPTLDPDSLDYRPIGSPDDDHRRFRIFTGLASSVVALMTTSLILYVRRKRRSRPINPEKLCLDLARSLDAGVEADGARKVDEALTRFLELVGNRSPGVLTPPEARSAFLHLTSDDDLAARAERLVITCDRASYGRSSGEPTGLIDEGRSFFVQLAEAMGRKRVEEERPREAAETA